MSASEWAAFQRDVEYSVKRVGGTIHFSGQGVGYSDEWGFEQAFTVVAAVRPKRVQDLRVWLSVDGWRHGQEAIGFTLGDYWPVQSAVGAA